MNTIQKFILGIVAIAVIVFGIISLSHKTLGDATVSNYPTWYYNGIVIGSQNTLITNMTFGSCNLTGAASMTSLASATLACSAPSAKVGDKVFVQSPTPVVSGANGGFPIIGATVTTAGSISITMVNQTGGTATPSGVAITGIQFIDLR